MYCEKVSLTAVIQTYPRHTNIIMGDFYTLKKWNNSHPDVPQFSLYVNRIIMIIFGGKYYTIRYTQQCYYDVFY